ncbi:nuclear transport factor 2 family protein [Lentzea sp. NPDC006480]|uniref:nuclear transport factor 2 family protein n=1 Tax=Lentzea sp. NPDC006480 TaxID=3157176 RepID=UPI0033BA6384
MNHRKTLPMLAAVACLSVACGTATTAQSPARPAADTTEEQNEKTVLRLFSEGFNEGRTDVVRELAGTAADDQVELFADIKAKVPGAVATVKHAGADGDLVAVHWQASATPADENTGRARADLYRVTGGKIVQHWGVEQEVPATTASGNSLFSDVYKYPNGAPALSEDQEETNKQLVVQVYGNMLNDPGLVDANYAPEYHQHNPQVPNGPGALKDMLANVPAAMKTGVPRQFDFQVADGDLVWVSDKNFAGVDIFRVAGAKIVEHWDVVGPMPGQ